MNNTHTTRSSRRRFVPTGLGTAALVLLLPIAACSRGSAASVADAMPDIDKLASSTEVDCDFDGADELTMTPTCYEISVPEDWAKPADDDRVVLRAAVFHSNESAAKAAEPLIYLDGGPGGPTLESLMYIEPAFVRPFVATRDVILFDQRGVGTSTPSLMCDQENDQLLAAYDPDLSDEESSKQQLDALKDCRERLDAGGVNFEAYNSVSSSHDIEAIRSALGYDRLNVWGISYGTRLAQTYMRLYPTSIRSVVIDSVEPVAANVDEDIAASAHQSITRLFEACAAAPACAEAYPDFESDFFALVDQLDENPEPIDVTDPDGEVHTVDFTGDDLIGLTFSQMYSKDTYQGVPQMVAEALAGNYSAVEFLAAIDLEQDLSMSLGMNRSVECHEEVPFESPEGVAAKVPEDPRFGDTEDVADIDVFDQCALWESGRAADIENQPVTSDIPTLVMTGSFDPITPPEYAKQVATTLSSSYLFEFPTEGHGVSPTECGIEIMSAFLDDPTDAPDASCIVDVAGPIWVPGGEADLQPSKIVGIGPDRDISVTAVAPNAWIEDGPGYYYRGSTLLDPAILIVDSLGELSREEFFAAFYPEEGFEPTASTEVDGEPWDTYTGFYREAPARLLISPSNEFSVMITSGPDEIDDLVDDVATPVAASMAVVQ